MNESTVSYAMNYIRRGPKGVTQKGSPVVGNIFERWKLFSERWKTPVLLPCYVLCGQSTYVLMWPQHVCCVHTAHMCGVHTAHMCSFHTAHNKAVKPMLSTVQQIISTLQQIFPTTGDPFCVTPLGGPPNDSDIA